MLSLHVRVACFFHPCAKGAKKGRQGKNEKGTEKEALPAETVGRTTSHVLGLMCPESKVQIWKWRCGTLIEVRQHFLAGMNTTISPSKTPWLVGQLSYDHSLVKHKINSYAPSGKLQWLRAAGVARDALLPQN